MIRVDGLLLCSECENQLRVDVYSEEFGFYRVYPCVHCFLTNDAVTVETKMQIKDKLRTNWEALSGIL